jgi:hypothetical protein
MYVTVPVLDLKLIGALADAALVGKGLLSGASTVDLDDTD